MTRNETITAELKQEAPAVAGIGNLMVYSVPRGYFEGLDVVVLDKINSGIEPVYSLTNHNPYTAPNNYFQDLSVVILQKIKNSTIHNHVFEEMETISPFLNTISKRPVYTVPQAYFDSIQSIELPKQPAKIIRPGFATIYRFVAAAVVMAILAVGLFLILNKENNAPALAGKQKIEIKNLSEDDIADFLSIGEDPASATMPGTVQTSDIHDAVKDIPEDEIKQFLQDSEVPEGI